MKIKVLDLFSGIGGFHLGLTRAGFEVESYFSEIDKYAIDVYSNNFKNATYVGSVVDIRGTELPRIDAITFGSPCQDFSLAGKRKGLEGDRSSLIGEAIRLISELRPSFFIWENVKGTFSSNNGEDFWAIIQAFTNIGGYRLEWQLLNTKWFLPQNRERIYLVGYLGNGSGRQVFPVGEINSKNNILQGQSTNTLTARYSGEGQGTYVIESKLNAQEKIISGTWRTHKHGEGFREIKGGDAPTIPARAREDGSGQPVIKYNYSQKSINETLEKENLFDDQIKALDLYNKKAQDDSPTLTEPHHNSLRLFERGRIRRLTPIECERLQGFPDNWTAIGKKMGNISDTQRYKMCGNAVTVDVVAEVAKRIKLVI